MDKMSKKECKEEILAYMSQTKTPQTFRSLGEDMIMNGRISAWNFGKALQELVLEKKLLFIETNGRKHYMRSKDVGDKIA